VKREAKRKAAQEAREKAELEVKERAHREVKEKVDVSTPQGVKGEVSTTPKPWSAPSLTPPQPQVSAPTPPKTEPEKPHSLWERKKLKTATQSALASNMFGGDDATNPEGVRGDAGSGGRTGGTIAMPTITGTGDRQSIFTDTAREPTRENQNLVGGFLGSDQGRSWRNNSAQSQTTTNQVPKPVPGHVPKSCEWGLWGNSLLVSIAREVTPADRSPPPEHPPV